MAKLTVLLTIFTWILFFSCSQTSQKNIPYTVSKDRSNGSRIWMHLLVDSTASKEDVINLGTFLKNKYSNYKFVNIFVFNNEYVERNFDNPNITEVQLYHNYLLMITVNKNTGFEEIAWMNKE
jgi:hypothetical protein